MRALFLDTSVLVLAYGTDHPLRQHCRGIVRRAHHDEFTLNLSTEAVHEFLHHRMRRAPRTTAVTNARDVVLGCVVHPLDAAVLQRSISLVETTPIRGRDAVHAATALEHGFTEIVSTDRDFDSVPGLRRVDPGEL